jgi:hypothetical protein
MGKKEKKAGDSESLSERFNKAIAFISQEPVVIARGGNEQSNQGRNIVSRAVVRENVLNLQTALPADWPPIEDLTWRTVLSLEVNQQNEANLTIMGITPSFDENYDHEEHRVLSIIRYGPDGEQIHGEQIQGTTDMVIPEFEDNWSQQPEVEFAGSVGAALVTLRFIDLERHCLPVRIDMNAFVTNCLGLLQEGKRDPSFIPNQLEASKVEVAVAV